MLDASANQYCSTKESEPDVLIVYSSTDAFVTGGGWMWDAKCSGHGNFGFVVGRYEHLPR